MEKQKAKEMVKRRLWNWSKYSVRDLDYHPVPGAKYDLIVNGKFRLKVVLHKTPANEFDKWDDYDIIAAVSPKGEINYQTKHIGPTTRPQDILDGG